MEKEMEKIERQYSGGLLEHAAPKKQYTCVNLKVHHQTAPGDELL
jgi:hypothetical protein